MNFQLGSKWKQVAMRAWSMRLMTLAAVLQGAEIAWPFIGDAYPINPVVNASVTLGLVASAFMARLIVQKDLPHG